MVYTLRLRQDGHHFADDIVNCIFFISLKLVPKGSINNISALIQIMAWCWPGNKPLSEPMVVRLWMHIFITRPPWVNGIATFYAANSILLWLNCMKYDPLLLCLLSLRVMVYMHKWSIVCHPKGQKALNLRLEVQNRRLCYTWNIDLPLSYLWWQNTWDSKCCKTL